MWTLIYKMGPPLYFVNHILRSSSRLPACLNFSAINFYQHCPHHRSHKSHTSSQYERRGFHPSIRRFSAFARRTDLDTFHLKKYFLPLAASGHRVDQLTKPCSLGTISINNSPIQSFKSRNKSSKQSRLFHGLCNDQERLIKENPWTPLVLHSRSSSTSLLSLKGILDAAPVGVQPYLRLIRFDRPIGKIQCEISGCLLDMSSQHQAKFFCRKNPGISENWSALLIDPLLSLTSQKIMSIECRTFSISKVLIYQWNQLFEQKITQCIYVWLCR
jgi:hypothetical protein